MERGLCVYAELSVLEDVVLFKERDKSDMMAQTCNPSTHEVKAGGLSQGTD